MLPEGAIIDGRWVYNQGGITVNCINTYGIVYTIKVRERSQSRTESPFYVTFQNVMYRLSG